MVLKTAVSMAAYLVAILVVALVVASADASVALSAVWTDDCRADEWAALSVAKKEILLARERVGQMVAL